MPIKGDVNLDRVLTIADAELMAKYFNNNIMLSEKQIKAIAEILSSPRLWLIEGNTVQGVRLTTDRVMVAPNNGMSIVEVDIRAAEEGVQLW